MATASNIDSLRQKRNQHLDNIKFTKKDIDDYEQSGKHNVDVLKRYLGELENEWKRFRLVQEELYDLDEEENTQEREAFGHYISLASRLRNLIEGRRPSTLSVATGSEFPAKCSSPEKSSTTDNDDHPINANNADATAPHKKRFECPRNIALCHSRAIVNFPKIREESPTVLRHLINTVEKNLRSLNNLGESIGLNTIIISLISSKLPANIVRQWKLTLPNKEVPQYTHLLDFLKRLESSLISTSTFSTTKRQTCPICRRSHRIWRCGIFKAKSVSERLKDVKAASLCTNCLKKGHSMLDCYAGSCHICGEWHNTMLHEDKRHSKSRSITFSRTFFLSSSRSSRASSTSSSSPTRHRKSETEHKSEIPGRNSSSGSSSSHQRTRKQ
ncbi:uncharacterized protein LOC122577322 [Bombus pyrosoma]|uniref:uncharacterized protein LOC122577322 n=1 Tax=Bombus pyrosoma TaxID=396416 RepID=UPI001CB8DF76|nr:uncharacterized protein LOC122577322 [Bombus pyrosoma]XP_043604525.1 uncharacterized protein LOC122577322 [Bombus pyrosoma]XP_043604526.1 uncharacterized protein LOC122577322 [Bombus pyrosoma]